MTAYTFYVTIGVTRTEVHPLGFLETSLVDEKESGKPFYRRKFSGNLIFTNLSGSADYTLLNAVVDKCAKITFEIERDAVAYWNGCFTMSECKPDKDACTFEVQPRPDDDYFPILENTDTEWNITGQTVSVTTRAIFGVIDVTYSRNQFLYDVIEYLADKVKSGVTVSSTFFTAANNPVTQSTNKLLYLTIAQKSDIIRPTASDGATELMLSWNSLMQILWGMFQVSWNYDSATDTINIEHISWFNSTAAGLNLTSEPLAQATNKYEYIKGAMPKYEKFAWAESLNNNFTGVNIWYDSDCVDQNPDTNYTEVSLPVTTDLDYIISYPLEIADEGIVILCNNLSGGNYYVDIGVGKYDSNEIKLNMHLSWANLHDAYFRHNRVLPTGYLNNVLTTFWTSRKTIMQETRAMVCPDESFDPTDEITTQLGTTYLGGVKAKVGRAELSPDGLMKLKLEYGAADVAATPITEGKWVYIYSHECGKLTAVLSEAADQDYTVQVKFIIFDNLGAEVCEEAIGDDWVIESGDLTDTYDITPCAAFPPAYEWTLHLTGITGTEFTAEGWGFMFITPADCVAWSST